MNTFKIMIIDDSVTSSLIIKSILIDEGYDNIISVESAGRGVELLKASLQDGKESDFDLILMDIVMPGMDGIQATREIKRDEQLKDIPVVMVSVKEEEESLENAFEAGAIDFINKPVNRVDLRARVRSILRLKKETDDRKNYQRQLIELTRCLEESNRKLLRLSTIDGLTGVSNRRYFDESLNREWQAGLKNGTPITLLLADIDYFKKYNDHYGHIRGDECLKQVAVLMSSVLRRGEELVSRYGGEEFVVLLPNSSAAEAIRIAENIRLKLHQFKIPHAKSDISDNVTLSIGVSTIIPKNEMNPLVLVSQADDALYTAKKAGRDQISVNNLK